MRYASRTWSGISTSGSGDTSCWIRPIGKIGVRSSGPAGCIVPGLRGGIGSPGRSGSRLTQCVGISDSGSRYLTVSWLTRSSPLRCRAILWAEQLADETCHFSWLLSEPPPGDAHHAVAGRLEGGITLAILLEGAAVAVGLPAVELDNETLLRPEGIDQVALHEHVAGGERQAVAPAQLEEGRLELAPGIGDDSRPVLEQREQVPEASAAAPVFAGRLHGSHVKQPAPLSCVPSARKTRRVRFRDVEQGAGDAGDRDAVADRAFCRRQVISRVHDETAPLVRAARGNGHVNQ